MDDKMLETHLVIYQECLEDIRFLKQQQWRVTYYCLLLFTAIFFLNEHYANYFTSFFGQFSWLLIFIPCVIAFIGIYVLFDAQSTLNDQRIIINDIRVKHSEQFKILGISEQDHKDYYKFEWGLLYPIMFSSVIFITFWIIILKIFNDLPLASLLHNFRLNEIYVDFK